MDEDSALGGDGLGYLGLATRDGEYIAVEGEELKRRSGAVKACHCMIYARTREKVFGKYDTKAAVLMQMRFDGHLGFPGGCADPGEDPVAAVNREMHEEMGMDTMSNKWSDANNDLDNGPVQLRVTSSDWLVTHWSPEKRLLLYFYVLEVTPDQLARIERGVLKASDYGGEVLGMVRVPLFTLPDGYRGFPSFLRNQFIGNSRQQLLHGLTTTGILTNDEVQKALLARPVYYKRAE